MRLDAQFSLGQRAEFDLAPSAPLSPPRAIANGDERGFVQTLEPLARRKLAGVRQDPDKSAKNSAERDSGALQEPRLSTQLRIELDELAGRFVYRRFDPPDPEPVSQYPSEAQLAFSRALNVALRAVHAAEIDLMV